MNIITVTLNPAIDAHFRCDSLKPLEENPYILEGRDSGGKGVNVSRALHKSGINNLCYVMVGEENAEAYLEPLRKLGMHVLANIGKGAVRENVNIHTPDGDTVLAGQGACVDVSALLQMRDQLLAVISEDSYLCFCGRIPRDADKSLIIDILLEFKTRGAKLILDSRSFTYADIAKLHPYLIKPNAAELAELVGSGNVGKEQAVRAAAELSASLADNVLVTLGADGAVFASGDRVAYVSAPSVPLLSTTGAGDSAIAGFLCALYRGFDIDMILKSSVAFGTAACVRRGTLPPREEDIDLILQNVNVEWLQ